MCIVQVNSQSIQPCKQFLTYKIDTPKKKKLFYFSYVFTLNFFSESGNCFSSFPSHDFSYVFVTTNKKSILLPKGFALLYIFFQKNQCSIYYVLTCPVAVNFCIEVLNDRNRYYPTLVSLPKTLIKCVFGFDLAALRFLFLRFGSSFFFFFNVFTRFLSFVVTVQ